MRDCFDGIGDAVLGLLEAELVEQALEAIAVLGEVDRVDRRAENGRAGLASSPWASFSGVWPPYCTMTPNERAAGLLDVENFGDVFGRQRLEIETVRRVVVGRDRFRIAVDHDRFEAGVVSAKQA